VFKRQRIRLSRPVGLRGRRDACGITDGKRQLGKTRRRRWDNVNMDIKEVEEYGVECFDMDQNMNNWWAVVNTVMNLRFP
jgi:hypothetical protein